MKKRKKLFWTLLPTLILGLSLGCGMTEENDKMETTEQKQTKNNTEEMVPEYVTKIRGIEKYNERIDYSDAENWLALPEEIGKAVDVIYLYPTVYGTIEQTEDDLADIDDVSMRIGAIYSAVSQAGVFEESCNIFAPYYRQFTVESLLDMIEKSPESLVYCASQDLYPMLDYYFENLNNGRPFILAGHSQGSVWQTVILEDYMKEHPQYLENMVAAYVIGYSITEEYLARNPHLKFAERSDDTGVIISYNTEGPGNKEQYNCVVKKGAISINPINWKLDDTYAAAEENLGSLDSVGNIVNNYADARVDSKRGVVVCESVAVSMELQQAMEKYFGTESFHLQDYSLYFMNLQQNAADRIKAFMSNNSAKG